MDQTIAGLLRSALTPAETYPGLTLQVRLRRITREAELTLVSQVESLNAEFAHALWATKERGRVSASVDGAMIVRARSEETRTYKNTPELVKLVAARASAAAEVAALDAKIEQARERLLVSSTTRTKNPKTERMFDIRLA